MLHGRGNSTKKPLDRKEQGVFRNGMKADVAGVQRGWSGGTVGPEVEWVVCKVKLRILIFIPRAAQTIDVC